MNIFSGAGLISKMGKMLESAELYYYHITMPDLPNNLI